MSLVLLYLAYVLVGCIAGLFSGLLGIGGGMITVPCLFYIFHLLAIPQALIMHAAVATSLAAMIFNTLISSWAHHKKHNVLWDVFFKSIGGIVVGSCLGALIATWLSTVVLEVFFGLCLCLLAVRFYRQKAILEGSHKLPSPLVLNGLTCGVGAISNLLGIGGGSFTVPLLTYFRVRDRSAIGTSATISCITTILGTISYAILGRGALPGAHWGLVNIPAFLTVGIAAMCLAPYGAKLTTQIDPQKVRRIFAIVLAITGISFLI
jgi:hypothetical protein